MKRYGALFALLLLWTACLPTVSELTLRYRGTPVSAIKTGNEISDGTDEASTPENEPPMTEPAAEESEVTEDLKDNNGPLISEENNSALKVPISATAQEIISAVQKMDFQGKQYTVYDREENRAFLLREEEYLVLALAAAFPNGAPSEAMKAQAIALRSVFLYRTEKSSASCHQGNALCTDETHCAALAVPPDLSPYVKAVKETHGKYLSYNGKPALALSHRSSSAFTAEQTETDGDSTAYLSSVPVLDESEFKDYKNLVRFTAEDFKFRFSDYDVNLEAPHSTWINNIRFDSTNRLKTVQVGGLTFSVETFSKLLGLKSHCPVIITTAEGFAITCYGSGNGLGMSRCSAVLMAENGKSYGEILRYFYPGTKVAFFYSS